MEKRLIRIAIIVGLILLIPLFGNIFTHEWNWSIVDFIIMGTLLFGTGLAIDFVSRNVKQPMYRMATVMAIIALCLAIWAQLAVDWVSQLLALFP
ncbi:MAG TPA: hypothetical protein PLD54_00115 [Candidatus Levybacteria bacterium]|nr:hypothetical protein [Candidatus Levybacteria bacterium]